MSSHTFQNIPQLDGEFHTDEMMRKLFATDASAYRHIPAAVAFPANKNDLHTLIDFAHANKTSLIPRTAGTSLAGQVVGDGIVVDVSRHFRKILDFNAEEGWVRVQPGVIRDELNLFLKPHGFIFGPETSTANRAMLGGMVGNNSCGSNSLVYGSTRDHLLEVEALLSDGSKVLFTALNEKEFAAKRHSSNKLEAQIYEHIWKNLSDPVARDIITAHFPKPSIHRRNTGYALDKLMECSVFDGEGDFNFCRLIAGSEGTLAFVTEIKLHVNPLPAAVEGLLCLHFTSINETLRANVIAMEHQPTASELIDDFILERTKDSLEYSHYRFFLEGNPKAILVVGFRGDTKEEVIQKANALIEHLKREKMGYAYPLLFGEDCDKVWALRKAGLGLLSNIPGDEKPAGVIEDTAVDVRDLPDYITEFDAILKKYNKYAVYYAHAGSGELHLRPVLNLKSAEGQKLFRAIAEDIADLVKKYNGSLSGEHGDGRLRGEFIQQMVGEKNYDLMCELKHVWDPDAIFNPGKIVFTPPMDAELRYKPDAQNRRYETILDFGEVDILQHAEQCNGSGDCRKRHFSGGTMCPSYQATLNEKDTTRARANIIREHLTDSDKENPYDSEEIHEVMDNCLSCKGCKAECPSGVDIAKVKMEYLQHYYDAHGVPLRSRLIAHFAQLSQLASVWPGLYNFLVSNGATSKVFKSFSGFAPNRSLPPLYKTTLRKWFRHHKSEMQQPSRGKVLLFCDEFTNFNDTEIGIKAVQLLERLGYEVSLPKTLESGRASLSKGMLRNARKIAEKNVELLAGKVTEETPLVGIEPSAILSFRDEYPDLLRDAMKQKAQDIAKFTYTFEEFILREIKKGNITHEQFTDEPKLILIQGHCHQKALSGMTATQKALMLPRNYKVRVIPSGCCGMAGSFGYEKEHYDLSQKIGGLVLYPTLEKQPDATVAAAGTSCRHQIKDGVHRRAYHPAEILCDALR